MSQFKIEIPQGWTKKKQETIRQQIEHFINQKETEPLSFNLTDLGNAERLVHRYGDIIKYCEERKRWLIWNGKVWEWDWGTKIMALAKQTVREIYREAADEPDEKKRGEIASYAKRSESDNKISAMISLAQSERGIPIDPSQLDADPWLFNCLNGTLNLKTGELLPHRKDDLLTIIVPIKFESTAQCPQWLKFLERVTAKNTDLQSYLQQIVGYSLTGQTIEQCLFFLYGLGNNGKTTFLETLLAMMGEYGDTLCTETLMTKGQYTGGPKEALANLRGKRLIVASEVTEDRRLNVGLVKDLTGSDRIKADRKYEHEICFSPTHKLWIRGNHKPMISETSLAIWRRMRLIPFTVTIPPEEVDKELPAKLRQELAGILAWAVKGCLAWQQEFLVPQVVTRATAEYRREQDILAEFLEDCCLIEPAASISKANLKSRYEQWCSNNSIEPVTQRTFRARLIERGIGEDRVSGRRLWQGIRLREENDKTFAVPDTKVTRDQENGVNFFGTTHMEKFPDFGVTLVTPDIKK